MKLVRAACLFGVLLAASSTALAEPNRFAVIIGANAGDAEEPTLRFAESDADRVAGVLRTLGGFQPENVVTLNDLRAAEVRRALISLNARVRALSGDSLMVVYYSGHADADALHLAGTHLPMAEVLDDVFRRIEELLDSYSAGVDPTSRPAPEMLRSAPDLKVVDARTATK